MDSRRILITGLSTYWGGRLARALERLPEVEAVIGVSDEAPHVELERTEFVKVGAQHALLRRVVEAAEIDTVVDTRLVVDSLRPSTHGETGPAAPRETHENNVIGTMNILAACSGVDSPVRKVVFRSSTHYYGSEQDDPAFFDESMVRPHPARTPIERDIVEAEASLGEFADRNPDCTVTILRFADVLGPSVETSLTDLLSLPAVPMILGFDPRLQFVHEDDVVHALEHAVKRRLPGVFNVAADGVLALTEVAGLLGKPYAPVLPPWGTGLAASALRRLGVRIPPEAMNLLRFGRGVDNRRFKATGFEYGFTSRETVLKLAEHLRLRPVLRGVREPYRYEREVEDFLRWSPYVRKPREGATEELSREQLVELQRLLASVSESAGLAPEEDSLDERLRAAEERAAAAERAAREAAARVEELERARQAADRAEADTDSRTTEAAEETDAKGVSPGAGARPVDHYDELAAEEVIALLASLDPDDLSSLREYERRHANRARVISAIESVLARSGSRVQG